MHVKCNTKVLYEKNVLKFNVQEVFVLSNLKSIAFQRICCQVTYAMPNNYCPSAVQVVFCNYGHTSGEHCASLTDPSV